MHLRRTYGFSLIEVVVAALIIGSSAIMILELIRASTVTLEITEYEAAARTLGSDVMKRLVGRKLANADPLVLDPTTRRPSQFVNGPVPFRTLFEPAADGKVADLALARAYPLAEVGKLLDLTEATVTITVESPWKGNTPGGTQDAQLYPDVYSRPISRSTTGLDLYRVHVKYMDPRDKREKEVNLVRLLAVQ